jgi:hypothetical protein
LFEASVDAVTRLIEELRSAPLPGGSTPPDVETPQVG